MFERTVLPNGLRVITSEMPQTRSATVSVYVGAGSRYEQDDEAGLSHFLEHMLFKGASRRPTAQEISEAIESVGGLHNAATDRELTVYYAKTPDWAALETIDILSDMVTAPEMDPAELEKERMVILEELAGVEDSPGELAGILADETLWPDQPLGRNIGGTTETARKLPLSAVEHYFRAQYVPSNIVLSVAGNITHETVVEAAFRWLGHSPQGDPRPWHPIEPRGQRPRVGIRTKASEQAHLCLTYPALPLGHPDQYAASLLSALLGEGMSSRLFLELREKRALVYDVHSYLSEYHDAGALTIYAGCDPSNARVTLEVVREEIDHFLIDVTDEELEKGKRMAAGRMQLRMEDTRAVAAWIGGQELVLEEVLTVDEVVTMIEEVTLDDLRRVGGTLLQTQEATIAAVGPFEDDSTFVGII
ncbi:MAG: peptidase M16 [Acidobacteria bacterium]|nr:peptidase M16 [Acidobacteriota bacterium]HCV00495.1 insulinase family protein [Dehalococcoidia bacterium]